MDFALNEEQTLFQNQTRQFLESKGDLTIPRSYMEGKEEVLEELWKGLGDLGYMGITISEEYGGLGLGDLTLVPILEEMGRVVVPGPYPETVAFAVPLLQAYGTEAQKQKYLPSIAEGKRKVTLAVLEASGELAPSEVQLQAKVSGDEYVLQGTKILVPHGDIADTLIVPVRTGGTNSEYGISLVIVDADQVTLDTKKQISMDETRKMVQVTFNEVRVPKAQLLGPENAGWGILQSGLIHLNAALTSTMVGGMDRVVEMSTEYAKTREQFGQPIGRFQAIKHRIVDMKLDMDSARSLSYYASWAVENKTDDMVEAVALARSFSSEAYLDIAGKNIQNHGGMGFTWEFDCHFFLKRARALENHLGSPESFRETAAVEMGWNGKKALV
ncbi:acyl-CoA dehydrogenase family protein [Bacillus dakarensis]|uniref:acyl-CoA dehydrogenase family protein n=1 Tax=Robertmurraya dakarensis TaxID=1926278 RepID=UPI0009816FE7|nr:acyl-CoA dehydrogenase family protein [Bacillus dakarensis]